MFAPVMLIALTEIALANVVVPDWKLDYATALRDAGVANKPLAVLMGRGKEGWQQVSASGGLKPEAVKLLKERYVCLYVDTGTTAGRELAQAFGNSEPAGLVLSDKSAKYQIFKQSGPLDDPRLQRALEAHVAYEVPQHLIQRTNYYQPAAHAAPTYVGGFGGLGGGAGRACVG
jgi:hypothetical protein